MRLTALRRPLALAMACGLVFLASPAASRADFLAGFSGNTLMEGPPTTNPPHTPPWGDVSFAVYQNTTGGSWLSAVSSALGITLTANTLSGSAAGTANAQYVYIYEAVNVNTSSPPLQPTLDLVKVKGSGWSSGGYLTSASSNVVFQDTATSDALNAGKNVEGASGSGNYALGPNPIVPGSPTGPGPSVAGITGFKGNTTSGANSKDPVLLYFDGTFTTWSMNPLAKGQWSTLLFLTSNSAPSYNEGRVTDNGTSSAGYIPNIVPEPISMVHAVFGLGGLLMGGGFLRRRNKQANKS